MPAWAIQLRFSGGGIWLHRRSQVADSDGPDASAGILQWRRHWAKRSGAAHAQSARRTELVLQPDRTRTASSRAALPGAHQTAWNAGSGTSNRTDSRSYG